MSDFQRNRLCNCARCRLSAITGPAILITIGSLFLIGNYTRHNFFVPVLLIVIGLLALAKRTASTEGHIPPGYEGYSQSPYGAPQAPYGQPPYSGQPYPYGQPQANVAGPDAQPPVAPTPAPAAVTPPPVEYPSLPSGDKEKE